MGPADAATPVQRVYLGTYTDSGGKGIAKGRVDPATGTLVVDSWLGAVAQPSWLALSGDRKTLYAASELVPSGQIHALRLGAGGDPAVLNQQPTGSAPTHAALHPGGRFLFTALYGGGAIAVHSVAANGTVGAVTDTRPQGVGSHAHQVVVDPTGAWVVSVDLGMNKMLVYSFSTATGRLTLTREQATAPGAGPRHLAFNPNGLFAYVVNELNSTVAVFAWSAGRLTPVGTYATVTAAAATPNYPGEVAVSKDGRFVYVTNRGANSVAVFRTSAGGRVLTLVATPTCGGDWPRHLTLDPTGAWLYVVNQRSGSVVWFPVDSATGLPGAEKGRLAVTAPTQLLFA